MSDLDNLTYAIYRGDDKEIDEQLKRVNVPNYYILLYVSNIYFECETDRINAVKYLINYFENTNNPINIHSKDEVIFRRLCVEGRIQVMKYLIEYYSKTSNKINIHACGEHAMRVACRYSHLDTVKYLIEYGEYINSHIDLHCINDSILKLSCEIESQHIVLYIIYLSKHNYGKFRYIEPIKINILSLLLLVKKYDNSDKYKNKYIYNNTLIEIFENTILYINTCDYIFYFV